MDDLARENRARLIAMLRLAYSGELAAAHAYRGHWRSVSDPEERIRIRRIEEEEWHHRRLVGRLLEHLGAAPSISREARAALIGRVLGALCHVAGRFAPMYCAGRLESRNIREYEDAARYAYLCGRAEWVDCLLTMAEVEWKHEHYFRARAAGHRLIGGVPLWLEPPAKVRIRASFLEETGAPASLIAPAPDSEAAEPVPAFAASGGRRLAKARLSRRDCRRGSAYACGARARPVTGVSCNRERWRGKERRDHGAFREAVLDRLR